MAAVEGITAVEGTTEEDGITAVGGITGEDGIMVEIGITAAAGTAPIGGAAQLGTTVIPIGTMDAATLVAIIMAMMGIITHMMEITIVYIAVSCVQVLEPVSAWK